MTDKIEVITKQLLEEIGEDPKTGEKIYARHGKYGAYVQKGELILT